MPCVYLQGISQPGDVGEGKKNPTSLSTISIHSIPIPTFLFLWTLPQAMYFSVRKYHFIHSLPTLTQISPPPPQPKHPKQNIHLPPWAGEPPPICRLQRQQPTSGLPGYQGQFSAARYNSQSLLGLGEVTDLLGSLGAPGVDVEMWRGKGTGVWRGLWGSIGVGGIWRNLAKGWDVS